MFFSKAFFQKKKKKKKFLKQKSFTSIKMSIFSKLFIWHLFRGIVRIESVVKEAAAGKSRAVIGWKKIDESASLAYNI